MKEPKDISKLFKDNEDKLNQPPSSRAWERLENRLDNHRSQQEHHRIKRRPNPWRNILSMTGVLLVLVTMISAISLILKNQSVAKTAMNEKGASPMFVLEEIGVYSDQIKNPHNIGLYEKQLKRLNTNPFLEGDPSKELRVQREIYAEKQSKYMKANNNTLTKTNKESLAMATTADVTKDIRMESTQSMSAEAIQNNKLPNSTSWMVGKWIPDHTNKKVSNDKQSNTKNIVVDFIKIESFNNSIRIKLKIADEEKERIYEFMSTTNGIMTFANAQLSFPGVVALKPNDEKETLAAIFRNHPNGVPGPVLQTLVEPEGNVQNLYFTRTMVRALD
ncbi:MAG: hypothetical protein AB8F74_01465 [Saprospiraceae bacterium]